MKFSKKNYGNTIFHLQAKNNRDNFYGRSYPVDLTSVLDLFVGIELETCHFDYMGLPCFSIA